MALRLIEITVPTKDYKNITKLLQNNQLIELGSYDLDDSTKVMRFLIDSQQQENISDILSNQFTSESSFRLVAIPVEATIPSIKQDQLKKVDKKNNENNQVYKPHRISREELSEDISQASKLTSTYVVMVLLSTAVAAVGLIRDDIAIIIGAMVIAPLLGPNIALSLAFILSDSDLAKHSLKSIFVGVLTALTLSLILGFALEINPAAPELASRIGVDFSDIILGLAAGGAGALAFTSGVPAVVVGVMVAVALLPPLVVAGLLMGSGSFSLAIGALILALTNVTCINLAAMVTFYLKKIRPRTWWEAKRAKKASFIAIALWLLMLLSLSVLVLSGYTKGL